MRKILFIEISNLRILSLMIMDIYVSQISELQEFGEQRMLKIRLELLDTWHQK